MSAYSELAMATAGQQSSGSSGGSTGMSPAMDVARFGLDVAKYFDTKKARKEAKREAQRQRRVDLSYNVASGIADVIQQHVERMTDFRIRAMAMNTMGKAGQLSPEQMWIASQ